MIENKKHDVIDWGFLVIGAILAAIFLFWVFNILTADHSILRYEVGSYSNGTADEQNWIIVGVRDYWPDDMIVFPRKEYTFEQIKEEVSSLNGLLAERKVLSSLLPEMAENE